MTPRRPSPARPGIRARSAGRTTSRGGASRPQGSPEPTGAGRRASSAPEPSSQPDRHGARPRRPERPQRSERPEPAARTRPTAPSTSARRQSPQRREPATREEGSRSTTIQAERPARPPRTPRLAAGDGIAVPARALILALVLLGAFVVTFPSLRGYLTQRAQYDAIEAQIRQAQATATAMESELARWEDEDYVRTQARARLSFVMPGETTYVVVGAEQFAQHPTGEGTAGAGSQERPWYDVLRDSSRVAGVGEEPAPADPAQQGWSTQAPTALPSPPDDGGATAPTPGPAQESR